MCFAGLNRLKSTYFSKINSPTKGWDKNELFVYCVKKILFVKFLEHFNFFCEMDSFIA